MVREKGIYELLEAIHMLRKKFIFRFTFVGGGTLEAMVRKRIVDSGWERDVIVLGWRTADEVQQLLELAEVFVLPSYAEGFPNSLLEAMAKGLPCICSDVGAISDSLKNGYNGYLIPPREIRPLARAMERYLSDSKLVGLHSKNSLDVVKSSHSREINCKMLFGVFE